MEHLLTDAGQRFGGEAAAGTEPRAGGNQRDVRTPVRRHGRKYTMYAVRLAFAGLHFREVLGSLSMALRNAGGANSGAPGGGWVADSKTVACGSPGQNLGGIQRRGHRGVSSRARRQTDRKSTRLNSSHL